MNTVNNIVNIDTGKQICISVRNDANGCVSDPMLTSVCAWNSEHRNSLDRLKGKRVL